jgi:hypothetical protein
MSTEARKSTKKKNVAQFRGDNRRHNTVCLELVVGEQNVKCNSILARFQVLRAASTKTAVSWVVAACRLVEVYGRFISTCCLHHQGDES